MKIGQRSLSKFAKAIFSRQHYLAFINILLVCRHPVECLNRYLLGSGAYPIKVALRTPLGKVSPEIYSYYDMLTVNEIFCRRDYKVKKNTKIVVDIGSNIGISALYFLTRHKDCYCYLFEPDPSNIEKLKANLNNFKARYRLEECAISTERGMKLFGKDATGRCGGLNRKIGDYIKVRCCHINDILEKVFKEVPFIDILKIDIEGDEIDVLRSIDDNFLKKIKNIYFEVDFTVNLSENFSFHPEIFFHKKYGEIFTLTNRGF